MKMSCSEEDKDKEKSSAPSCVSMKSDKPKDKHLDFRTEPGPSDSKGQQCTERAQSSASSCVSEKSDRSREWTPNFRTEPGPSASKYEQRTDRVQASASSCVSEKSDKSKDKHLNFRTEPGPSASKKTNKAIVCEEAQLSCCSLCQDVLMDPVSTSCGHWFCRQCITLYWDRSDPSGLCSCPQCAEIPKSRAGLQTISQNRSIQNFGPQKLLNEHQISLKSRCEHVTERSDKTQRGPPLKKIYTELYITEGLREEVHTQHEVCQLETISRKNSLHNAPIRGQLKLPLNDIFKPLPDQHGSNRLVLTIGVAGIGKTFSVQKFTLDWAEGLENQDISAVVPLSFREMNLIRDEQHSLLTLIQRFHPTFQKIPAEQLSVCKLLFIFDGLDESRLSLDFNNSQMVSDVTQKSSINVLLTNLIQGRLLPSALVWITSRPAAANQIPLSCVSRVTEVQGFTDSQKEECFRRRFSDEDLSSRIISHIKASKSLFIMCEVPIFCWITAVVLEHMLTPEQKGGLPTTMTDMYSHFLMVQTKRKKNKYQQEHEENPQELTEADMEVLLKLGRLAFEHLEKGNIMFYQEDLEQCGLDVTEASLYSGVCTEIFRRECQIFQKPVYSFVHLSVQEFLAAVYMIHRFTNKKTEVIKNLLKIQTNISTLDEFLSRIMKKSLQSQTGHLDLFVRFLHGLSVESNQRLLGSLLGQTENSPEIIQRIINNLKEMKTNDMSPDRSINIFHCLMEMKDLSVHQEIQEFLKSENRSEKELSEIHCSALAYMLQMSEEVLDELYLDQYKTSREGRWRLIPAVRNCKKFRMGFVSKPTGDESNHESSCYELSETDCQAVAFALKSNPSHLTELDLSGTVLQDSAVKTLCAGLKNQNCKLETLKLRSCCLSDISCEVLVSALKSNRSHLTELVLDGNNLQDSGVIHLCGFLESPDCRLKTLRLRYCGMTDVSCGRIGSVFESNPSNLTELDLSRNNLQDSGVKKLFGFLRSPDGKLRTLRLRNCSLSEISCEILVSALKSNPSRLTELDLSENYLKDLGGKHLCGFLESLHCRLKTLRLKKCSLTKVICLNLISALKSNPSHLEELDLSGNDLHDSDVQKLFDLMDSPDYKLKTVRWNPES
ncbi:NACHT, LRR and PYD domains-containing protein 12-like isoform X2 [Oryzias latipes]|uniref:NACHT, LRR and PYD domains-containing protein 12-like isoform X2 n=1 Tax=Oryzias latipes TaxID=8090 RepID=UPI0009DB01A2|nr:NACHT, LRR and PYD domains-containing protein 12-like isoform X2 [Oryzias latipes]